VCRLVLANIDESDTHIVEEAREQEIWAFPEFSDCARCCPKTEIINEPVTGRFLLATWLNDTWLYESICVPVPTDASEAETEINLLAADTIDDLSSKDVNDIQRVISHDEYPALVFKVTSTTAKLLLKSKIDELPVLGIFEVVTSSGSGKFADNDSVRLPIRPAAVNETFWLLATRLDDWQLSEVSENQTEPTMLVPFIVTKGEKSPIPKIPDNVTLKDPLPGKFMRNTALREDKSVENTSDAVPTREPAV